MTPITPIQEGAIEHLRNAQAICQVWGPQVTDTSRTAFAGIHERIRKALEQLGEPNAAMCAATTKALADHTQMFYAEPPEDYQRYVRDTAAILLDSQLKGAL